MTCPNCGDTDWFECRLLGQLTDPFCGHEWYATSGLYAAMQVSAAIEFGDRLVKTIRDGPSGRRPRITNAIAWAFLFPVGLACRLGYSLILTPIQAMVRFSQCRATKMAVGARSAGRLGLRRKSLISTMLPHAVHDEHRHAQ